VKEREREKSNTNLNSLFASLKPTHRSSTESLMIFSFFKNYKKNQCASFAMCVFPSEQQIALCLTLVCVSVLDRRKRERGEGLCCFSSLSISLCVYTGNVCLCRFEYFSFLSVFRHRNEDHIQCVDSLK